MATSIEIYITSWHTFGRGSLDKQFKAAINIYSLFDRDCILKRPSCPQLSLFNSFSYWKSSTFLSRSILCIQYRYVLSYLPIELSYLWNCLSDYNFNKKSINDIFYCDLYSWFSEYLRRKWRIHTHTHNPTEDRRIKIA